jgi:gluconolactonase
MVKRGTYPIIGSVQRLDPSLDSVIDKDAVIEVIADGFDWSEGPLWLPAQQKLLFSDIPPNTIYQWTEAEGASVYLTPSGYTGSQPRGGEKGSNALLLDAQGRLVLCQHGDRRMAVMDAPLTAPQPVFTTLADRWEGLRLNSPNDAIYRSDGALVFTDPPYGLEGNAEDRFKEIPFQGVYLLKDGQLRLLTDTLTRPNGLAFLEGEKKLIVANSDPEKAIWYVFDIGPGDTLQHARIFYDATPLVGPEHKGLPDGLKVDAEGHVFATGPGGVFIFDRNARLIGKLVVPGPTSNIALADEGRTLFITADNDVLRVKMRK